MRVAQLVTQPRGGPVDHAVDVAVELAGRGHDSRLIGPVGGYAARLRAAGVLWYDVAVRHKADVTGARELRRVLREMRADVLHCQDMRAGMVGRLVGIGAAGVIVYTVHGVPDGLSDLVAGNARVGPRRRGDRLRYLATERWLARLTNARLVAPCAPVATYLVEHVGVPAGAVAVVPNGIDPQRFAPRPHPARERPAVLWLGLLGAIKRVDLLVRATADLDVDLVLVGDGPARESLAALATELGVTDRVAFRGHIDDPATVFADGDVFALPSAAEAHPLALLQAMSAGLPVVATRVGGIPDVVRDGVDGLLVDAGDPAAVTTALRRLVTDVELRASMGASARDRVVAEFSLARCVDRLVEVYRR